MQVGEGEGENDSMMRPTTTTAFSTRRGMASNAGGRRSRLMILLVVGIIGICIFGKQASPWDHPLNSSNRLFPPAHLGKHNLQYVRTIMEYALLNLLYFFSDPLLLVLNAVSIQVKYRCHVLYLIVVQLVRGHPYGLFGLLCLIDD